MKKLKTLKDIVIKTSSNDGVEQTLILSTQVEFHTKLQMIAREWIENLEHLKDLHSEYICNGIGENPTFEQPEGFDFNGPLCYTFPFGYDNIIDWIKYFFDLDVKNEEKSEEDKN